MSFPPPKYNNLEPPTQEYFNCIYFNAMNGTCVCTVCGKAFQSKNARAQHAKMAHESRKMVPKVLKTKRGRGGRRRGQGTRELGADIAPSRIPAPRGNTIVISGEDRLFALDIKKGASVFTNVDITPAVSQRLGTIARAYQRIRWDAVKVIVTPQASTLTNGGYVCGFVMDPEDRAITARDLSATQGSRTCKWYESAVVSMPRKPDLLYTSPGEEARLSTPCSFWVIGEGAPSSDLTIIVTFVWRVTLSQPTVEDISNSSFTMRGEIRGKQNNYNLSWFSSPSASGVDDVSPLMPEAIKALSGDHYFRVPTFTIEYKEGTGDTGSIQAHFIVYRSSDKKLYYSSNGRDIVTNVWQGDVEADQVLVPCTTYCKYIGPGNLCKAVRNPPLSSSSHGVPSLDNWLQLTQNFQYLESFLRELKKLSLIDSPLSRTSSYEKLEKPEQSL